MKLLDALELSEACGLTILGEAKMNIELHAPSLFSYDELNNELNELNEEINKAFNDGFTLDDEISVIKYSLIGE